MIFALARCALSQRSSFVLSKRVRFRSFSGAGQAAEAAGDTARARAYRVRLVALCPEADTERAELKEARAALARQ